MNRLERARIKREARAAKRRILQRGRAAGLFNPKEGDVFLYAGKAHRIIGTNRESVCIERITTGQRGLKDWFGWITDWARYCEPMNRFPSIVEPSHKIGSSGAR